MMSEPPNRKVVNISDFISDWRQIFCHRSGANELKVFGNAKNGSIDFVIVDNNGKSMTTHFQMTSAVAIADAVQKFHEIISK